MLYDERHITGGSVGGVTELTADLDLDFIFINGDTLETWNADDEMTLAEGATLWTATALGDTFNFSRLDPKCCA